MREIPKSRPGDMIPEVSIGYYFTLGALVAILVLFVRILSQ